MLRKSAVRGLYLASIAAVAAIFAAITPAQANIVITPTFDSTITSDPNAATIEASINAAISRAENLVTNNTTCSITFQEMGSGLGSSSTSHFVIPYSTYLAALQTVQTRSANDNTALATLPTQATNPVNGNANVNVQTTLARALGIVNNAGSDGTIGLKTSICNISRTGTQNPGFYDLQAVAGHEIDEVLGIGGPGSALPTLNGSVGPLDLFRYASNNTRSFTTSSSVNSYFSIDNGATNLVYFDQNSQGADFADWGNGTPNATAGNTPPQLQDSYGSPEGSPATFVNLGINEATALDVIGYNINYAAAPEPASGALFI